jgi:hypothetical protein
MLHRVVANRSGCKTTSATALGFTAAQHVIYVDFRQAQFWEKPCGFCAQFFEDAGPKAM